RPVRPQPVDVVGAAPDRGCRRHGRADRRRPGRRLAPRPRCAERPPPRGRRRLRPGRRRRPAGAARPLARRGGAAPGPRRCRARRPQPADGRRPPRHHPPRPVGPGRGDPHGAADGRGGPRPGPVRLPRRPPGRRRPPRPPAHHADHAARPRGQRRAAAPGHPDVPDRRRFGPRIPAAGAALRRPDRLARSTAGKISPVGGHQRLTRRERVEPPRPGVPWDVEPTAPEPRSGGPAVALPNRFRRRLTWVFVGVVGVSSGLLAGGTYLAGRHSRNRSFTERAVYQTRIDLALTANAPFPAGFDHLSDIYRQLGGVESLAIGPGGAAQSSLPSLGVADVPARLRRSIDDRDIVTGTTTVRGTPYLVTGGRPAGSGVELYFFFTPQGLIDSLTTVRDWLLFGWLALMGLAALVARRMALVTLRPVRATAGAARSLAEGLLSTRLRAETDDEFGALASYFNDMAEALEQKIAALEEARDREERFTMFAAHELRTPLAGMSTTASLLEEDLDALPERARRPAELLVADVARLRGLVLNLLELGRLDTGLDDVAWEPVP